MSNLMLSDRKKMIRATEIAFADLSAGAKLSAQKAKTFVLKVREKAALKPYIDVLPIDDSNKLIMPWLEVPDQVMGDPQGLLNPADYNMAWVTTGDNEVETFPVENIVFLPDAWRDGNFQGSSGWDIALELLSTQFLANMEQAGMYSNILGPAIKESEVKKTGSTSNYIKHAVRGHYNGWLE